MPVVASVIDDIDSRAVVAVPVAVSWTELVVEIGGSEVLVRVLKTMALEVLMARDIVDTAVGVIVADVLGICVDAPVPHAPSNPSQMKARAL